MGYRRWIVIVLAIGATLTMAGCDWFAGAKTLDKPSDVAPFFEDIAKQRQLDWKLSSSASEQARRAWERREKIEKLVETLEEKLDDAADEAPDWGCKVLDHAEYVSLDASAVQEESDGLLSAAQAEEVVADIEELDSNEIAELARDVCDVVHSEG